MARGAAEWGNGTNKIINSLSRTSFPFYLRNVKEQIFDLIFSSPETLKIYVLRGWNCARYDKIFRYQTSPGHSMMPFLCLIFSAAQLNWSVMNHIITLQHCFTIHCDPKHIACIPNHSNLFHSIPIQPVWKHTLQYSIFITCSLFSHTHLYSSSSPSPPTPPPHLQHTFNS